MSEQKHIIKRQIIELQVQGTKEGQQLQAEVSRIYRQRIVPLIDQYCTALSETDRIHRIESLEIDLGYIDPLNLEKDFVAKVGPALYQALTEQIRQQEQEAKRQEQSPKAASQLELFAFFARTGSLPWWADTAQPQLLNDCLHHLIETAPAPLRHLMRELVQEQAPLQRIVYHYADELLANLANLLLPTHQQARSYDPPALIEILQKTRTATGKQPTQLRHSTWIAILHVAGWQEEQFGRPEPFYQAILRRIAAERGISYRALLDDIYQVLQAGQANIHSAFKHTLETLYWGHPGTEANINAPHSAQTSGASSADLLAALRALAPRLPTSIRAEWLVVLKELKSDETAPETLPLEMRQRFLRLLRADPVSHSQPLTVNRDWLSELRALAPAAGLAPETVSELIRLLATVVSEPVISPTIADETPEAQVSEGALTDLLTRWLSEALEEPASLRPVTKKTVDLGFSEANEVYISNAGLVILWPFLTHFFSRLDFLDKKQFKDAAATQRAAGLLQHIATEADTFPEYLLPLNKVLCGLELTEVFDFGPPLLETETEECADLLRAVIEQAPILRNMSVPGFRGTFLLRHGVLSSRDGAWLLRVERETYDVVLDRFPWSWEWVKLPWMTAPLRVEW
ncbi:MAG: hypothetical protein KDJ52_00935 [Anaerolineae bacterium]|nr:hypothetical protein [Anaerolineae bacterium]